MKASEAVRVELPKEGHWYDLRAHKYLGLRREIKTTLMEADPKLYAMLPYKVQGISLSLKGGRSPGEPVEYEATVRAGSARPVRHVIKVDVFAPGGKRHSLYSGSADTTGGTAKGSFRLALNDPKGTWRLAVTDVFSGETAKKSWLVR
jgi:hypothetical protein